MLSWAAPITIGVLAFIALVLAAAAIGLWLLSSGGPSEHDNPSFQYGEQVMTDTVYRTGGGPVGPACRKALIQARHKPPHFDLNEAVAGCKYEEYTLDN